MKTTDSVMREFDEKYGVSKDDDLITTTRYSFQAFISLSLAEARREWVEEMRGKVEKLRRKEKYSKEHYSKDGSCNICHGNWEHFESCDYAIYRQTGYVVDSVLDLLTGDNPEEAL